MTKDIRQAFTRNAEEFDALVVEMLKENAALKQALKCPTWQAHHDNTVDALYNELLFAVGNKYPDETRHETALRYIITAETPKNIGGAGDA